MYISAYEYDACVVIIFVRFARMCERGKNEFKKAGCCETVYIKKVRVRCTTKMALAGQMIRSCEADFINGYPYGTVCRNRFNARKTRAPSPPSRSTTSLVRFFEGIRIRYTRADFEPPSPRILNSFTRNLDSI